MTTIQFDVTAYRALFPPYSDQIAYPDAVLNIYWDLATAYISPKLCATPMNLKQQTAALNLMTAHLSYLNTVANSGQSTGLLQGATIDKVSIQLTPPPEMNQWQWWLNQSPYGQQLLALLQVATVGGFFFGGYPSNYVLRR